MYRILKLKNLNLYNVKTSTKKKNLQYFIKFSDDYRNGESLNTLHVRNYSSTINYTNPQNSFVKVKTNNKNHKKYAELLEVTDSATSNRKAAVQRLNANQLSYLMEQPDITLDKLHKIKDKNTNNFRIKNSSDVYLIDGFVKMDSSKKSTCLSEEDDELFLEELKTSGISVNSEILNNEAFVKFVKEDRVALNKNEDTELMEDTIKTALDKERVLKEDMIFSEKIKLFNKSLLAYIDVCVNAEMLSEAFSKILFFSRKVKPKNNNNIERKCWFYIDDPKVVNVLILKYALKADIQNSKKLFDIMKKEDMRVTPETYAYIFYCIGRLNNKDNKLELLKNFEIEMKKDNISFNDIMIKSYFIKDQIPVIKNMLRLLDNNFKPIYEMPQTSYNCRLLENLKEENNTPKSTTENLLDIKDLRVKLKEQIAAEINREVKVFNISVPDSVTENVQHLREKLENLENLWEVAATEAFKRNVGTLRTRESFAYGKKFHLYPYLSILKPEDYVKILMQEVKKLAMGSETYSLPFNSLCRRIGNQVFKAYETKVKENNGYIDKMSEVCLQYCDWFIKRNDKLNSRMKWTHIVHEANKNGITLNHQIPVWPVNVSTSIGRFIFNIIIHDLKLDVNYINKRKKAGYYVPAFIKVFKHSGEFLKEEIKPHPTVSKLYRDSQQDTLNFDTTLVPSLCPPRPWTSINDGGYIITKTDFVRLTHLANQQLDKLAKTPHNKLFPVFDSLNQLSSIPWSINTTVLDVAIKVFKNGGSVELNMPQHPMVLAPIPPLPKDAPVEDKRKNDRLKMELKRRKNEMYSLWCDALYRISLANHFRNKIFWLPHNIDFRGRVYPVPPHLNHLGSDLARSMLVFAVKKPLGPNGLKWLKLHTINLTGLKKKESISERLKYADQIMNDILDSAEKPLDGKMWWAKSDEPWQTLAACIELASALKSPNPEEYLTGFPIHQDGSCNGLQHYAALGRDQSGGESVNLYPCERPQDVYQSIANMIEEARKKDEQSGVEIAKILDGFIKRKVIKQTVMTTVYGVTWFGAKLQIARQLKDLKDFPPEHIWAASMYLVQKTFHTLRTMFKSAREIQDWFTECARLICLTTGRNMEWLTPLGLPVIQPYSKIYKPSNVGAGTYYFSPDILGKPNIMKQKNAFAPNYVHSLDSSHMMLTSIHTERAGITYVSVHDCYWTHPCTVEIMNKICREQFVALHSEPILEDLSKFFVQEFSFKDVSQESVNKTKSAKELKHLSMKLKLNHTLEKVPKKGNFDLNKVLSSTFFFS